MFAALVHCTRQQILNSSGNQAKSPILPDHLKDSFSFQVFENFKPENLTIPEILNRIATYSNLKADDYKAIQKGIEKVLIKEIKK